MTGEERHRFHHALRDIEDEEPLDPAEEDRLVGVMLREIQARRARRRRLVLIGTGALALAACLAIVVARPHPGALPLYSLSVPGDARVLGDPGAGGQAGGPAHLSMDSVLRVDLRPDKRVAGDVRVLAYLGGPAGLVRWDAPLQHITRVDTGTLRLSAPVRDLPGLGPGRWDLVFVLGRAGDEPMGAQIEDVLHHAPPERQHRIGGWQVLHAPVEISPP